MVLHPKALPFIGTRNLGVAASRESAAGNGFEDWRRSAETPLQNDGSWEVRAPTFLKRHGFSQAVKFNRLGICAANNCDREFPFASRPFFHAPIALDRQASRAVVPTHTDPNRLRVRA